MLCVRFGHQRKKGIMNYQRIKKTIKKKLHATSHEQDGTLDLQASRCKSYELLHHAYSKKILAARTSMQNTRRSSFTAFGNRVVRHSAKSLNAQEERLATSP